MSDNWWKYLHFLGITPDNIPVLSMIVTLRIGNLLLMWNFTKKMWKVAKDAVECFTSRIRINVFPSLTQRTTYSSLATRSLPLQHVHGFHSCSSIHIYFLMTTRCTRLSVIHLPHVRHVTFPTMLTRARHSSWPRLWFPVASGGSSLPLMSPSPVLRWLIGPICADVSWSVGLFANFVKIAS